jgi:LysM repeat protein
MQQEEISRSRYSIAFSLYLRTGRRIEPDEVEVKFNPWHDEEDGRFTFAGQGRFYPAGGGSGGNPANPKGGGRGVASPAVRPSQTGQRQGRTADDGVPDRSRFRPDHPDNHSIYVVQPGDSLSRIAARRTGLAARDLAWLNQQPIEQPLRIGQRIKLPNQAYLDAGRAAKNKLLALDHYMQTHDGKLPPDPANPPSLVSQILDSNWRTETKNGYDFQIDMLARPRNTRGELQRGPKAPRSRTNQAKAGKVDRRANDDGGHFIAARFNGPSDSFNHFAQNANFNRGAYRAMEDGWSRDQDANRKVFIDITVHYPGTSMRPDRITVIWSVDGKERSLDFANEEKGKPNDER